MLNVAAETKVCPKCKQDKPIEAFAWRVEALNRRHSYCRPCMSEYHRETKKKDGVLRKRCPICGIEKPRIPRYWNFCRRDGDLVIGSYCRPCKGTYMRSKHKENAGKALAVDLDICGAQKQILSAFRANTLSTKALYEALIPIAGA